MADENEIIAEVDWNVEAEYDGPEDDRKGLPSASEYQRAWACPGYLNLKKTIPKKNPGASAGPYADSGRKIHAALSGDIEAKKLLTDDEEQCFDFCEMQWEDLTARLLSEKTWARMDEKRLFLNDEFSGQFDRTAFTTDGQIAVTADFKTGRIGAPPADTNLQMRAYAVLLAINNPDLKQIYVAVIQPWVSKDPIIAIYDVPTILLALAELQAVLKASRDAEAKRIIGPHCKYCPCRGKYCPESRSEITDITTHRGTEWPRLSPQNLAHFLDRISVAESIIDAVRKEAEERLAAGVDIPGWILAPGRILETITKPEVVFGRVAAIGVNQESFMSAVKIGKTNLKTIVKAKTGLKGKGLDEQLAELLAGCTEAKQSKPYLKKIDPIS